MRILLVDDHEDSRELLEMWLGDAGHHVLTAGTLAEARPHLKEPIDALLSDIHLPDGDGTALAAEVRAAHPKAKTIALTGDARAKSEAFDVILTKPVDLGTLKSLLGG